jgi:hypothetical protein
MSRGLGKLQRYIKALIEAQAERFDRECEADPEGDVAECAFWLTWTDIRMRLLEDAGSDWDKFSLAAERAAKRALHTLWKRGEIGRISDDDGPCRWLYIPKKTYDESFSAEAGKKLKAALDRMEAAE